MSYRFPLALLAVLAAFAGGFASSQVFERRAQAQSAPFASSVYVPADGLAFRTFDGRIIARLSYGHRGGVFDLYDGDERPSTSLRAEVTAGAHPAPVKGRRIDLGF
jgi:hypothetical protein